MPALFPEFLREYYRRHWFTIIMFVSSLTIIACFVKMSTERANKRSAHAVPAKVVIETVKGHEDLDRPTLDYENQVRFLGPTKECLPLHAGSKQKIGILYLHCSASAKAKDASPVQISEHFHVSERMALRFNFWRRIYSLWSQDNYVLHISKWPEVVLETYDGTTLPGKLGPVAKDRAVKKLYRAQKKLYRKLFLAMHKHRNSPEKFSPAMKRIAAAMEHIQDKDKYKVASWSMRVQRGQHEFIANGLRTAGRYLPAIEQEFKSQGLPVELSRIAFVESSFNLRAVSKVGASGVYQIMPETGRQYLKMRPGIDERNDPIKASRAAAKLFNLNYKILGKWPLAVTAYNHGVGGLRKAVRRTGSDQLEDLIDKYYSRTFQFASKNFYASFLAVLATIKEKEKLFPEVDPVDPLAFETVRISKSTSLKTLKKKYEMSINDVSEFNPDLSRWFIKSGGTLPRGYILKVPAESSIQTVKDSPNS